MTVELIFVEKNVTPHGSYFARWITEARSAAPCTETDVFEFVVDRDAEGGADLFFHQFLLSLETVLLARRVQLGASHGWDRYHGQFCYVIRFEPPSYKMRNETYGQILSIVGTARVLI